MAYRIVKEIKNGIEYLPKENGGGGGTDNATVNALVDIKLKDNESLFKYTTTGLYKILNDITEEDELGLTWGENRAEIVGSQASMNKISHGRSVMSMIASSGYAVSEILKNSTAFSEIINSRVSIYVISLSREAMDIIAADSTAVTTILNNPTATDAIVNSNIALTALSESTEAISLLLDNTTLSQNSWSLLFANEIFTSTVYNNNTYLTKVSNNLNCLLAFTATDYWDKVLNNATKCDIIMSWPYRDEAISNSSSAAIREDTPLRSIIKNNWLDAYLAKDETATNGVIVMDINSTSATTFNISRYGYNAATSTWKYSVDWGAWTSVSVAASTTALSVSLGSTWRHTIVIKPANYTVWRARQMGNRSSTNYWTTSGLTWSIRNLPLYAFAIDTSKFADSYFMAYAFYGCSSLTEVNIKKYATPSNIGTYFMGYTFYNCTNLLKVTWDILTSKVESIGNYFMYNICRGSSKLTQFTASLNFTNVKTIADYFIGYAFYGCTSLTSGIDIDISATTTIGGYFLYYTYYNCWALTQMSRLSLPNVTTVGTYFMGYSHQNCTNMTKMATWFNLWGISASIGTYFLYYAWSGCSKLASLPTWFKLPPVGNSSYYCRYAWYNCTALGATAPTENLTFIYAASNCFSGTSVWTASPAANSSIPVHRE